MPVPLEVPRAHPIDDICIRRPSVGEGAQLWHLAARSSLDLNSSYAYLLFCRDFSDTCRLAHVGAVPAGFVLGYRRPESPETLFVWQVTVDESARGRRLASSMLDDLLHDLGRTEVPVSYVEATITADNVASQQLFRSLARRWGGAEVQTTDLFAAEHFPEDHDGEALWRIGPITL